MYDTFGRSVVDNHGTNSQALVLHSKPYILHHQCIKFVGPKLDRKASGLQLLFYIRFKAINSHQLSYTEKHQLPPFILHTKAPCFNRDNTQKQQVSSRHITQIKACLQEP
jgi:hypothetical protein